MKLLKLALVSLSALLTLSACESGESSSGGGSDAAFVPIVFTGTYDTIVFRGGITIRLVSEDMATILFTGIPCLQSEFPIDYILSRDDFNISNLISCQPNNTITGGVASITMLWPMGAEQVRLFSILAQIALLKEEQLI
jgi:hypothetical protein